MVIPQLRLGHNTSVLLELLEVAVCLITFLLQVCQTVLHLKEIGVKVLHLLLLLLVLLSDVLVLFTSVTQDHNCGNNFLP